MFPTETRSISVSLVQSSSFVALALQLKLIPVILEMMELSGLFVIFSFVSFAVLLAAYFLLPENKGQSLADTAGKS